MLQDNLTIAGIPLAGEIAVKFLKRNNTGSAEGATAPETLRHMDRKRQATLESFAYCETPTE
ncbi:hypothetical protein WH95_04785 [Kiloniella litopenaei]|uniref:Uncharacterized protein n=1 Tax=Kiloniella litopenaei TaxID=1549748 RepID=A0A0M2RBH1_9PROT|nr:hypothetical protein WH95_04785 [Kiloniella litopenaei]